MNALQRRRTIFMKYVLGLDIGTSSAKAAAVTLNGDVAALAHR